MVRGLDLFRETFAAYADQYLLIGGTAASLTMEDAGLRFRATKDLDIVLHVEVLTPAFGAAFWQFVNAGGYQLQQVVDTSIESDHQRFSGFLKISVEEMRIALRDDRHLLKDLTEFRIASPELTESRDQDQLHSRTTMYPDGFTAERFVEVVEAGVVWNETNV